jgi:hypothetical protein
VTKCRSTVPIKNSCFVKSNKLRSRVPNTQNKLLQTAAFRITSLQNSFYLLREILPLQQ